MGFDLDDFDLDHFKQRRKTDPSYKVQDAIIEYLGEYGDFDETRRLANQICEINYDDDSRLLSYDEVYELIELMDSTVDAFDMGQYSDGINNGCYYRINGYGRFEKVVPWDYMRDIILEGWEHIVDGECDISDDLQDIINMFRHPVGFGDEDDEDESSENRKSARLQRSKRSRTVKRPAPKKKASKPKVSAGTPKASQCKRNGASKPKATTKKATASKPKASANRASVRKPAAKASSRRY